MSYHLTKTLPSCFIERKLLIELEHYLKRKISEHSPVEEGQDDVPYGIIIKDSLGQERLRSIEDFQRTYFPDDTELIRMRARGIRATSLEIITTFGFTKYETKIEIQSYDKSAREITTGIAAEVASILNSYKTTNHWIHSSSWFEVFFGTGAIITSAFLIASSILVAIQAWSLPFNFVNTLLLLITAEFFFCMFFLLKRFKPYSTFETRQNERRIKQLNWILLGFLGFILFTVVGVYFRQKLFGF